MVNCGLHDIQTDSVTGVKQVGAAEYRDNFKKIIDLAQPAGLQLIWVQTTPVDTKRHSSYSRRNSDVASGVYCWKFVGVIEDNQDFPL
jgi:hypothetical protein